MSAAPNTMLLAAILGLLNHIYFHRHPPANATIPILVLIIQPAFLLLLLPPPSLSTVLLTYTTFLVSLILSITAYRLSPWHPLAHIPGPTINKVTKLWGAWVVAGGKQHLAWKRLHDKYGDFVRTGPNEISIVHFDAVKAILGTGGFPKGEYYDPRRDPTLASTSLLLLRGDAHASRRRIWNRGMSTEAINEYEIILERRVMQLMDRLDGFCGTAVDIAGWFGYFAFDFMGDMAFGGGFDMMRDGGDKKGLWELIANGARNIVIVSQTPWLSSLIIKLPAASRGYTRLRGFGATCAANRIKRGSETKDLWYHLTDEAGIEKTKPTHADVVSDGVLSVVAGSDTTAVALSCLVWFLLSHPDIYRRVQDEVGSVYPEGESTLDSSKHEELKLLAACLNETMRLQPPVLSNGTRQVPRGGGRVVAGRFIPEDTQIYIPPYSLHRNEAYFSDPEKFDPDRWLRPPTDDSEWKHNTGAFIPFSYGAANCVGKVLAWREMLMVASTLLRRYEMRFAQGDETARWTDGLRDYFVTSMKGPLMVEMGRR
ncbi:high nitrogen upregulated cytochrome P450 monooxygenase 2 [Roridomyces roridus]|uniref:High nitrogen upregulated cytochrome P450 monooxygenase 2 n=1 Tax=Roridomyces roridus TaxID=1738132 RepID=A0AAD7BXH6_9AGAR|nr:high nitrogen upregulated cytochrome P450 monooxygenase 2 [Roridomyces roridus]